MVIHRCDRCGYETKRLDMLRRHQNTPTQCDRNVDSTYECEFCNKKFKLQKYVNQHVKKSCPKKQQAKEENATVNTTTTTTTISTNNVHSHNNTHTDNSTHNHITVYGYPLPVRSDGTPVKLNSYHSPNLEYMPRDVSILLPLEGNHLAKTIERLYFNPLHPENHSIGHLDQKEKTCKVYTKDGFEIERLDDITIVIIRHLKSVYDSTKELVEMDPAIKSALEKIFDTISKAVRPQNEFYDIRDTFAIRAKKFDSEGIPDIKFDPDKIPPPSDTLDFDLWYLDRAHTEITERLDNIVFGAKHDFTDDQEWNIKMGRGIIYQLVVLRKEIEGAPTLDAAHKLRKRVDILRSSAENCFTFLE